MRAVNYREFHIVIVRTSLSDFSTFLKTKCYDIKGLIETCVLS
jgi:hypothetical protein